ncbi:MAG TPA: flavin reductase family protein [Candidatus Angelobacter sp.]|jgi:flavin reductase (DIM6/NTAB) family NADH-FMN oxidoreductase RutF|nr:flavin reductase family protein [Candidatus Angelobacter sp.]
MSPHENAPGAAPAQSAEGANFRDVIRHLASGVTVITSSLAGEPVGLTATAVCSVSATPPSLLISVTAGSRTEKGIAESGRFAVHLLPHRGRRYAEQFASRGSHFNGVQFSRYSGTDLPVLTDVLGWFVCEVEQKIPAADHVIFVGRVLECELTDRAPDPLLYFDRGYRKLAAGLEPGPENLEPWGSSQDSGLPGFGW